MQCQVTDIYSMHYSEIDRAGRRDWLLKSFYFQCGCCACTGDWARYQDLPRTVSQNQIVRNELRYVGGGRAAGAAAAGGARDRGRPGPGGAAQGGGAPLALCGPAGRAARPPPAPRLPSQQFAVRALALDCLNQTPTAALIIVVYSNVIIYLCHLMYFSK